MLFFKSFFIFLSSINSPTCKPMKLEAKDAIPMNDDDFLLAELNGHFK